MNISNVAKEAGVSKTTVSRVINENYPVSEKTKKKVLNAINKLKFKPNSIAKSLVSKKTYTIGVLTPSITNIYFSLIINGIQDFFIETGFYIFLCDTRGSEKHETKIIESLKDKCVDGIISIDPSTENILNGFYEKINNFLPLVLINGYNENINLNYVMNDQISGTKKAIQHLINLGHQNIVFLRGKKSFSYDVKEIVYKDVLIQNNIEILANNIICIENGNSIETVDLSTQAIENHFSFYNNRPTAIFCCNDWMAVGVLHAAQNFSLSVPNDLSVIGHDNIIISEIIRPKLTTIDQNMYRLGNLAAKQLLSIINEPSSETSKIILNTKLILRDSCKNIK